MVRLKDIAARAGVSVMTVSKVLRDEPDISPATKARIKLLAREMGYVPDSMAQGLRTRTTRLIGLVIPAATDPIFARAVLAVEEQAHELGYELVLAHTLNDAAREEAVLRRLLSRRVDGLIVSPVYRLGPGAAIFQEVREAGVPAVVLGPAPAHCAQFACVETDDLAPSSRVTEHLLGLGHRRIAYFAGPGPALWARERLEGYKRALREAGVELDEKLIFKAGMTIEEGADAASQLIEEGAAVTAVQASNDLSAIGAASLLMKQGRKIPEDVSVAGFGNILLSEYYSVPLTTVRQAKYGLGLAAMEVLRKLMRREPAESKRLEAELMVRASTGPAHAGRV